MRILIGPPPKEQKYREVLAWLVPQGADPKENHIAATKLQQAGTGVWFTESQEFRNWKEVDGSMLWLHGARKWCPH